MDTAKLEKLKKLLEVANDGLSKSDFLESFKKVIDQVLKIETTIVEKCNKAIQEMSKDHREMVNRTEADVEKIENQLLKTAKDIFEEQRQNLNFIQDKVRRIKEGIDGKDGQPGEDGRDGVPGKDADEEKIINMVLKAVRGVGDDKADKKDLKALEEELERLKEMRTRFGGGGGFSKIHLESKFIDDETPTGTVNGVNAAFTLANIPNPPASVKVFVNGARMRITEDYTLSVKTITFGTAPPTGSIILIDYRQ